MPVGDVEEVVDLGISEGDFAAGNVEECGFVGFGGGVGRRRGWINGVGPVGGGSMGACEIWDCVWLDAATARKNAAAMRAMVSDWNLSRFTREPFWRWITVESLFGS